MLSKTWSSAAFSFYGILPQLTKMLLGWVSMKYNKLWKCTFQVLMFHHWCTNGTKICSCHIHYIHYILKLQCHQQNHCYITIDMLYNLVYLLKHDIYQKNWHWNHISKLLRMVSKNCLNEMNSIYLYHWVIFAANDGFYCASS